MEKYLKIQILTKDFSIHLPYRLNQRSFVGLEELPSGMLKVYPNPSRGGVNFYLDTSVKEDARLSIYNALGKEINSVRLDHGQSYLWSGTTAGTYYYKLVSDGIMETGKVILLK